MKYFVVAILFIGSLWLRVEPISAREPVSKEDSIRSAQRKKAIEEFRSGKFRIPSTRVSCNSFYAEEVFYKMGGSKAEFYHDWNMCGTGMDDYYFKENCYFTVIDSLMYAAYGNDIYQRISQEGELLELHEPERYPKDDFTSCWKQVYDSDTVNAILIEHIKYPESARNDTIQGTVYVWVDYDSTGVVTGSSIMKSVRPDVDSAAMAGVVHIGKVNPDFRWGICQPGRFVIPVKFTLQ